MQICQLSKGDVQNMGQNGKKSTHPIAETGIAGYIICFEISSGSGSNQTPLRDRQRAKEFDDRLLVLWRRDAKRKHARVLVLSGLTGQKQNHNRDK